MIRIYHSCLWRFSKCFIFLLVSLFTVLSAYQMWKPSTWLQMYRVPRGVHWEGDRGSWYQTCTRDQTGKILYIFWALIKAKVVQSLIQIICLSIYHSVSVFFQFLVVVHVQSCSFHLLLLMLSSIFPDYKCRCAWILMSVEMETTEAVPLEQSVITSRYEEKFGWLLAVYITASLRSGTADWLYSADWLIYWPTKWLTD